MTIKPPARHTDGFCRYFCKAILEICEAVRKADKGRNGVMKMEIILTPEELKAERWHEFEYFDMKYKISSMGRLMSYYWTVQHLIKPQKNNYGYLQAFLTDRRKENSTTIMIGLEVAKAFVPNPNKYKYIRYKDGYTENCRASNLEWVQKTDKLAALHESRKKKINAYDENGKFIKTFDSQKEVCGFFKVSSSTIQKSCNLLPVSGTQFRYADDFPSGKDIVPIVAAKKETAVLQYDKQGNFIQRFESIKEATLFLQKPTANGTIHQCASGKRPTAYGYVWKFEKE